MGSYPANRTWLPMVLEHHILLHVLPPLWLFLGCFFKLILLCLGIKCWISLRLSLRPFSLFPLSPYIISTVFHGFSSHTRTNNFQMCISSPDLFFEFCNWYLIADLVLPLLCLRGISTATRSGLNLCSSTSYLSVFQYTLSSSTQHYHSIAKATHVRVILAISLCLKPIFNLPSCLPIPLPQHLLKLSLSLLFITTSLPHATTLTLLDHCRSPHIGPPYLF